MFDIRKKLSARAENRIRAHQKALSTQKARLQAVLDKCLHEPDAETRYLSLINFKMELSLLRSSLDARLDKKCKDRCAKHGFFYAVPLYAAPLAVGMLCFEPVSWTLTLAAVGKALCVGGAGFVPVPLLLSDEMRKYGYGRKRIVSDMADNFAQLDVFIQRTADALTHMEKENISELAQSSRLDELFAWRPELKDALSTAFIRAAAQQERDGGNFPLEKRASKPPVTYPQCNGFRF